ncbi:Zinc finger C-x8-C-x5-C-x3-H type (and similar) family protein [Leishmania donovani]|uniref:Zinc finger C-x8-C-x5-C-x3-H type (And similar) family protein n=1 Tax=Leishmania donovani TaxID=5661 RepID=A0A504XZE2_LEIDO|nr:Zinc finger C-x8-C-x5-C-x3-H type (and similar) family protein [Leishmania donovani]
MTKNRRHDIVKPSKYKTSMCTFFRSEEGCPFGEKCAFAHGEDELRPEPKDTAPLPEAATGEAQLPPPPLPGHGAMPSTTFGLTAPPPPLPQPTPPSFGLSGDFGGLAYAGMPAVMPGMPYYIPAMGHHPFSAINNNQHALNAAPVMHGSTVTRRTNGVAAADALPSDDAKHRLRQPTRHVVSSNTMAHSTGRHPINASATAPDDVATPQYLYNLMAAAGALLNSSPELASNSQPNPSVEQPAQPRLIVVPHPSGSGVCMVPSTVMSYPHSDPQSFAAFGGVAAASSPRHSTASMPGSSDSGLRSPHPTPTTTASNSAAAAQFPPPDFVAATPAPVTVEQLPLSSTSHGQSGSGSRSSKVMGDSLWGPAEGTMNPLTSSLASRSGANTSSTEEHGSSSGDYNAILSGLGIGGSSYTTIPLDRLMRQCSASSNEDDFVGGDFDWTGAVERWLQTAREDGMAPETAPANADDTPTTAAAAVATAEKTTASTPGATLAAAKNLETVAETYHLQSGCSVMAALNSNPVLVDMGIESTEANASLPAPGSSATEAKRRPIAAVCQVSRAAGGKPSQPQRRAPVTKNQFKSSCAAEADSGAVLLYCAEKNTFVYIPSGGSGAAVAVTPGRRRGQAAAAAATTTGSVALPQSEEKWPATTVKAVPALGRSQDSLNTPCCDGSLGIDVRFVPGRKKRSVLEEVTEEEAEYCI